MDFSIGEAHWTHKRAHTKRWNETSSASNFRNSWNNDLKYVSIVQMEEVVYKIQVYQRYSSNEKRNIHAVNIVANKIEAIGMVIAQLKVLFTPRRMNLLFTVLCVVKQLFIECAGPPPQQHHTVTTQLMANCVLFLCLTLIFRFCFLRSFLEISYFDISRIKFSFHSNVIIVNDGDLNWTIYRTYCPFVKIKCRHFFSAKWLRKQKKWIWNFLAMNSPCHRSLIEIVTTNQKKRINILNWIQ